MNHILVEIMSKLTTLSSEEKLAIENSFPIKTYEKGSFLLKKGQIARDAFPLSTQPPFHHVALKKYNPQYL